MNTKFSKALLLHGKDYPLTEYITLHHPTIDEILNIDETASPDNTYLQYVQIILSDPYTNMVMLDDMGKNYLEVTPFEVFLLQWDACVQNYNANKELYDTYQIHPLQTILNALQFFINEQHYFLKGKYDDNRVCLYDAENPSCQITQEIFEFICEWVKSINKFDYSNRIHPADENARRVLIEDMRDEMKKTKRRKKKKEDNQDYIGNLMSAVSFCGNGSITPFNIRKCKIYWLNEALSISGKKSNADHILDGMYHGTISSKDVNKKELDWMK